MARVGCVSSHQNFPSQNSQFSGGLKEGMGLEWVFFCALILFYFILLW